MSNKTPDGLILQVKGSCVVFAQGPIGGPYRPTFWYAKSSHTGISYRPGPSKAALRYAKLKCIYLIKEGWVECTPDWNIISVTNRPTFDFYNPQKEINFFRPSHDTSALKEHEFTPKRLVYSRKMNGVWTLLVKSDHWELYDSEWNKLDSRYDYLKAELETLDIPNHTVLMAEAVTFKISNNKVIENYAGPVSYNRALLGNHYKFDKPIFYIWDVAFWNNRHVQEQNKYLDRISFIENLKSEHIQPTSWYYFETNKKALDYARTQQYEGFVVIDSEAIGYSGSYTTAKTKPRPVTCGKLKLLNEDDFICFWSTAHNYSQKIVSAENDFKVKSMAAYQYNSAGQLEFVSNLSSGLTKYQRYQLAYDNIWPKVFTVRFSNRFYKSKGAKRNSLIHPKVLHERLDKLPTDCINPDL